MVFKFSGSSVAYSSDQNLVRTMPIRSSVDQIHVSASCTSFPDFCLTERLRSTTGLLPISYQSPERRLHVKLLSSDQGNRGLTREYPSPRRIRRLCAFAAKDSVLLLSFPLFKVDLFLEVRVVDEFLQR